MKKILLLLTALLWLNSQEGVAQKVKLIGRVVLLNSKYNTGRKQFIKNVEVDCIEKEYNYHGYKNTDNYGIFHLTFDSIPAGTTVKLNVLKEGYFVVYPYVIENVIVGMRDTLEIVMGNIEAINKDLELYSEFISSDVLALLKKDIQDINEKLKLSKGEQRTSLLFQRDKLQERQVDTSVILEMARIFLLTNLDYAPDFIITAFQKFRKRDIKGAIEIMEQYRWDILLQQTLEIDRYQRYNKYLIINGLKISGSYLYLKHNFESAISFYEKALSSINSFLDSESFSQEKILLLQDIGDAYIQMGHYQEAISFLKKSLAIKIKTNPSNNSAIAKSYYFIGTAYENYGSHDSALEYGLKSLELWRNDPTSKKDVVKAYNNIAVTNGSLGYYKLQVQYMDSAILLYQEKADTLDSDYATYIANTGAAYGYFGEYIQRLKGSDSAFKFFEKANYYNLRGLNLRKKILADSLHPLIAFSYSNLGVSYFRLKDYQKATECIEKSIEIRKQTLDNLHPDIAVSYINLGFMYHEANEHKKELEYMLLALSIFMNALDSGASYVATAYGNVGWAYRDLKNYDSALVYFKKIPQIHKMRGDSIVLITSYVDLADSYSLLGDNKNSGHYYSIALAITQKLHESNNTFHDVSTLDYQGRSESYFCNGLYDSSIFYSKLNYQEITSKKSIDSLNLYKCKIIFGLSYLEIASNYRDHGNLFLAFKFYDSSLSFFDNSSKTYESLAKAQLMQKLYNTALTNYEYACELDTLLLFNPQILNYIGVCYFNLGKVDTASNFFNKAFDLGIDRITYYNNYGLSEVKKGDYKNSKQAFENLNRLGVEQSISFRNWAFFYARNKEYNKVVQNMKEALNLGYSNDEFFNDQTFEPYKKRRKFKKIKLQMRELKAMQGVKATTFDML